MVLSGLQQCNLNLSADKCFFLKKGVKFLGHYVSSDGIETDPEKTKKKKKKKKNRKNRNWPRLLTVMN